MPATALLDHRLFVAQYHAGVVGYAHSGEQSPMDRMHAATGLQEEAIELHEVLEEIWDHAGNATRDGRGERLLGEAGGVMWYVAYCAHVYGHTLLDVMGVVKSIPIRNTKRDSTRQQSTALLVAARDVASQIKKHAYHGKPMESTDDLLHGLYRVWTNVALCLEPYGCLVTEAMAYNLDELEFRHKGKSFDPTVYTEGRK